MAGCFSKKTVRPVKKVRPPPHETTRVEFAYEPQGSDDDFDRKRMRASVIGPRMFSHILEDPDREAYVKKYPWTVLSLHICANDVRIVKKMCRVYTRLLRKEIHNFLVDACFYAADKVVRYLLTKGDTLLAERQRKQATSDGSSYDSYGYSCDDSSDASDDASSDDDVWNDGLLANAISRSHNCSGQFTNESVFPEGVTPLFAAIAGAGNGSNDANRLKRSIAIIRLLLEKGADVEHIVKYKPLDKRRNSSIPLQRSPLMEAVISTRRVCAADVKSETAIVEILLEGGADPNTPGGDGITPLMMAVDQIKAGSTVATVDILLADPRTDAHIEDLDGDTALSYTDVDTPKRIVDKLTAKKV